MTKRLRGLRAYFRGIDCTFRLPDPPECMLLGRLRCRRPCSFYFSHDPRALEKAAIATFVIARARASTDHALAVLALIMSLLSLAIAVARSLMDLKWLPN